jgi:hypothetical protein
MEKIKLDVPNYLSNIEKNKISENFDKLENDPKLILKKDDKMKYKKELYLIILFYRLFLKNGKFSESLKNILKDEETKKDIYKNLVKWHELFEGIDFEKEQVSEMVKASDNFRRIKRSLSNIVILPDYLEIILENLEHIIDIRNKEIKENKKKQDEVIIEIDKKMPRKNDDIKKVCEYYKKILDKQKLKGIEKLIIFSLEIFDRYIKFFRDKNLANLILLKNLAKETANFYKKKQTNTNKKLKKEKEEEKKDDNIIYKGMENKLIEIIHQTGVKLSYDKKIKKYRNNKFYN